VAEAKTSAGGLPAVMPLGFRADFVSQVLAVAALEPVNRQQRRTIGLTYAKVSASAVRRLPVGARLSRSA
jgi:hypothetical protein